jgi:hypothetical protein
MSSSSSLFAYRGLAVRVGTGRVSRPSPASQRIGTGVLTLLRVLTDMGASHCSLVEKARCGLDILATSSHIYKIRE